MRDHGPSSHRWAGGMHRAQGLAGPTRRYAVLVMLLVALASVPTLAAIGAGAVTLDATADSGRTTPFIVQPPGVPVVVVGPPERPPAVARGADVRSRERRRDGAAAAGAAAQRRPVRAHRPESGSGGTPDRAARRRPAPDPDEEPRLGWRPFAPAPTVPTG